MSLPTGAPKGKKTNVHARSVLQAAQTIVNAKNSAPCMVYKQTLGNFLNKSRSFLFLASYANVAYIKFTMQAHTTTAHHFYTQWTSHDQKLGHK